LEASPAFFSKAWKKAARRVPDLGRFFPVLEVLAAGLLAAAPPSAPAQFSESGWPNETEELPAAAEILRRVRDGFPSTPLRVRAQLLVRDRRGEVERTLQAGLRLDWRAHPPRADFVVFDAFGEPVARATWRREANGAAQWRIYEGDPPVEQSPARPDEPVAGTNFTWLDLGLDPLWWPDGKTVGTQMKKSRLCYVIEIAPPRRDGAVARARLLIDAGVYALLEAETFDAAGNRLKRLEVKSLQKVNDVWTLQDMEIRDFATGRRTTLRVLESAVEDPAESAPQTPPKGHAAHARNAWPQVPPGGRRTLWSRKDMEGGLRRPSDRRAIAARKCI